MLDSMTGEKELARLAAQLKDRFGALPAEVENLFNVVRIRNMGALLGFEKIIIKNGLMIFFFVSNTMSPYYRSGVFDDILAKVSANPIFNLRQTENKLKLVVRGVDSLDKAFGILKKLQ